MVETWPVIPPLPGGTSWAVDDGNQFWTNFDTEVEARRYAALPVLIAALREACCEGAWCKFCEADIDEGGSIHHDTDCPGIAALKAAGEEP